MGIFRSFFGRKSAAPPEIWEPPAPRAELGLPPIDIHGRTEPAPAAPGGYHRRQAYRADTGIPAAEPGERWTRARPEDHQDSERMLESAPAPPAAELAPPPEPVEPGPAALTAERALDRSEPAVAARFPKPPEPGLEQAPPALVSAPPPAANIRTILSEIETLGDSPELGLLRETLGAEPDGLFGFCTMYPPALITLLRNRFAGTGALENMVTKPAWGYHYLVDQRYGFTWKSAVSVTQMGNDAVLIHESARLTRLRDQLIRNLTGNKRLFVYAGPASPDHIASIRAAMRGYGVNTLLHLVIADGSIPAGEVVWQEEGLLRGALSRYGKRDGEWDIAVDDWIAVCRAAHQKWKDSIPP